MDPVSIVGIAAAALQFVDFASRLLSTGWKVYRDTDGRDVEFKNLSIIHGDLERLARGIQTAVDHSKQAALAPPAASVHRADVVLRGMLDKVSLIADEIAKVLPRANRYFENIAASNDLGQSETIDGPVDNAALVGDWFWMAIEQVVKSQDIKRIRKDLEDLRTVIIQELTASLWSVVSCAALRARAFSTDLILGSKCRIRSSGSKP